MLIYLIDVGKRIFCNNCVKIIALRHTAGKKKHAHIILFVNFYNVSIPRDEKLNTIEAEHVSIMLKSIV